ncbi:MAG: N-methyl-L-tryptophan oxidase [Actinomycetota bacterium]
MEGTLHDLAVVGLGAMGSAVAWHGAKTGLDVVGIDRHAPPHTLGSTHAETRITRLAVAEGDQYLPFVARSHELWREIEHHTGRTLFHQTGGYIVTDAPDPHATNERWHNFTQETAAIAARADIPYELMTGGDFRARHPQVRVFDDATVGFEPSAGIVMCDAAVAAQLDLAAQAGATLHTNTALQRVDSEAPGSPVTLHTTAGAIHARHVVLAAGSWLPDFVPPATAAQLTVTRQVVFWFEADDLDAWSTERLPFVMWIGNDIDHYVAAFPVPPDTAIPAVKILGEQFTTTTNPADVDRTVSPTEIRDFYDRLVAPNFDGIRPTCLRAEVCLYTNTPDDHFLIDTHPDSDRITIMSPCSGHGFKHSTALAEAVVQRITTGRSDLDLEPFRQRV